MRKASSLWILEAMKNEFNKKNVDNSYRGGAYAHLHRVSQFGNDKADHRVPGGKCDLRYERFHQCLCERHQAVLYMDYE